jgi:hypothetical protein
MIKALTARHMAPCTLSALMAIQPWPRRRPRGSHGSHAWHRTRKRRRCSACRPLSLCAELRRSATKRAACGLWALGFGRRAMRPARGNASCAEPGRQSTAAERGRATKALLDADDGVAHVHVHVPAKSMSMTMTVTVTVMRALDGSMQSEQRHHSVRVTVAPKTERESVCVRERERHGDLLHDCIHVPCSLSQRTLPVQEPRQLGAPQPQAQRQPKAPTTTQWTSTLANRNGSLQRRLPYITWCHGQTRSRVTLQWQLVPRPPANWLDDGAAVP